MSITAETLSKTLQLVTCFLQIALSLKGIHHQRQDTRTTWKALLIKPCYRYCEPSTIFLSLYLSQLLQKGCSSMGTKPLRTGSDQIRHHKVTRTCPSFGPKKIQFTWASWHFKICGLSTIFLPLDKPYLVPSSYSWYAQTEKREMFTIFRAVTIERKIWFQTKF